MRVRLNANWADDATVRDAFNRSSPNGDYRWKDLELTLDDDYDWLVVFNYPTIEADPKRTVIFQSEPRPSRQRIAYEFGDRMRGCRLVDTDGHFNFDKWYVERTYAQLREPIEKTRQLSAVVSATSALTRHRQRLDFVLERLPQAVGELDHYGRGLPPGAHVRGEVADKAEALLPYRYTFNAENSLEPNYFTEKILDSILCECLCFYDGCPNLEAFLDPSTFVRVSLDRPDEAIEIVRAAIAGNEWEKRLDAIREQKRRLMDELNPLEIIRKVLTGEPVFWRTDDELDAAPPEQARVSLPPVYVVNLPGATARAERVTKHLHRLGIDFELLEAVRGDALTSDEIEERVDTQALVERIGRPASGGELGCALSHVDAMDRLLASGADSAIVFEDDVRLVDGAAPILERLGRSVHPGDLVLIGAGGGTPLRFGRRRDLGDGVVVAPAARGGVRGTYGYLITREAAAAVRSAFPRIRGLADDWSLVGGVALLRVLDPRIAWTWGPFIEPSDIADARLVAVAQQTSEMRHSLVARIGYKARLIAAAHPRYGYRIVKLADLAELATMIVRSTRFRLLRRGR